MSMLTWFMQIDAKFFCINMFHLSRYNMKWFLEFDEFFVWSNYYLLHDGLSFRKPWLCWYHFFVSCSYFFVSIRKAGDYVYTKVSYFKFNADIEIANISSVFLWRLENGGCAHVACLGSGSFFLGLFSEKWWLRLSVRFHISSLMLILRLLTFVLCCCVSQET